MIYIVIDEHRAWFTLTDIDRLRDICDNMAQLGTSFEVFKADKVNYKELV